MYMEQLQSGERQYELYPDKNWYTLNDLIYEDVVKYPRTAYADFLVSLYDRRRVDNNGELQVLTDYADRLIIDYARGAYLTSSYAEVNNNLLALHSAKVLSVMLENCESGEHIIQSTTLANLDSARIEQGAFAFQGNRHLSVEKSNYSREMLRLCAMHFNISDEHPLIRVFNINQAYEYLDYEVNRSTEQPSKLNRGEALQMLLRYIRKAAPIIRAATHDRCNDFFLNAHALFGEKAQTLVRGTNAKM